MLTSNTNFTHKHVFFYAHMWTVNRHDIKQENRFY